MADRKIKSEASITKKIRDWLTSNEFYFQKIAGGNFQTPGIPDIICGINGRIYFFEVKTETNKATLLQIRYIRNLQNHGIVALVVRSLEEVKEILQMKYEDALIKSKESGF